MVSVHYVFRALGVNKQDEVDVKLSKGGRRKRK